MTTNTATQPHDGLAPSWDGGAGLRVRVPTTYDDLVAGATCRRIRAARDGAARWLARGGRSIPDHIVVNVWPGMNPDGSRGTATFDALGWPTIDLSGDVPALPLHGLTLDHEFAHVVLARVRTSALDAVLSEYLAERVAVEIAGVRRATVESAPAHRAKALLAGFHDLLPTAYAELRSATRSLVESDDPDAGIRLATGAAVRFLTKAAYLVGCQDAASGPALAIQSRVPGFAMATVNEVFAPVRRAGGHLVAGFGPDQIDDFDQAIDAEAWRPFAAGHALMLVLRIASHHRRQGWSPPARAYVDDLLQQFAAAPAA